MTPQDTPLPDNSALPDNNVISPPSPQVIQPAGMPAEPVITPALVTWPPEPFNSPPHEPTLPAQPFTPAIHPAVPVDPIGQPEPVFSPLPQTPPSKKFYKHRPFIIAASLAVILIIALPGFYFGYWTRSNVVYTRFQKNIAHVIDQTGTSGFDLINDLTYKADLKTDSGDLTVAATSDGRAVDSGFDSSSNITYKNATLNVGVITLNNDDTQPNTYFIKLKGISAMLKAVYPTQADSFLDPAKVSKYDDKWISISLDDFYGDATTGTAKEKIITKAQYQELWRLFAPIIKSRIIAADSKSSVYKFSNPRTEKVGGKSTWAFDITYDKKAYNDMLDEAKKAVAGSSLTTGQKKIVTDVLESQKETIVDSSSGDVAIDSSGYRTEAKTTIWLEKNTGWPLQIKTTSESFLDNKSDSKDVITVTVSSITSKYIKGTSKVEYTSNYDKDTSTLDFTVNNTTKTLTSKGSYENTTISDSKTNKVSFTLTIGPNKDKQPVTKPTTSVPIKDVINDLYGTTSLFE